MSIPNEAVGYQFVISFFIEQAWEQSWGGGQ